MLQGRALRNSNQVPSRSSLANHINNMEDTISKRNTNRIQVRRAITRNTSTPSKARCHRGRCLTNTSMDTKTTNNQERMFRHNRDSSSSISNHNSNPRRRYGAHL